MTRNLGGNLSSVHIKTGITRETDLVQIQASKMTGIGTNLPP